ncbi:MAG: MSEP-CTERM sorting domain-containing protein [Treponema sp.]|nr:MSEP-CTERM sorting domain-containing protein [Treponema sp.]
MKNLTNPKWLLVLNTLPVIVLFLLLLGQYNIIKSLLSEESVGYWKVFSITLGLLGTANLIYSAFLIKNKKNVSFIYGIVSIIAFIAFIYLYFFNSYKLIPFDIPGWMMDTYVHFYPPTFLMPTIAYSLMLLVLHFTSRDKVYKTWINFLFVILIPLFVYLFWQLFIPLFKYHTFYHSAFFAHALLILFITITLVFFFFLTRGVFIVAVRNTERWKKHSYGWKIPITFVLPLLGLLVNNQIFDIGRFTVAGAYSGIFGNFNNIWFYIIAALNGIILCLPNLNITKYRIALYTARCITLIFSLYFFIVFLPLLPFSIIAITAFGAGFLMLTPLALFIVHINELRNDHEFLKNLITARITNFILILSLAVIPSVITVSFLNDKSILNKTLEYLYAADYSKEYNINKKSLKKTIDITERHRSAGAELFFSASHVPYLSSYFNWIVFGNLTLSDAKMNDINRVFFDKPAVNARRNWQIATFDVSITDISSESIYDETEMKWKSWINLELTNQRSFIGEYLTEIELPQGCWISDYYLYVEDEKEYGILAEKRSAIWIYSNIRNMNRDPGLLHYLTGNKVSFRVFPFAGSETRKTGIEFIHAEPVSITIDGNVIELGTEPIENKFTLANIEAENYVYFTAYGKSYLERVQRKPYFHFLVDTSSQRYSNTEDFMQRIDTVIEQYPDLAENAKISFVNSYAATFDMTEDWKQQYSLQEFDGGFYLDRGIRTALYNAYKENAYAVIAVVTFDIYNEAIIETDFSDFKFAFPESDLFFSIDKDGTLLPHSLINNPKIKLLDIEFSFNQSVLEHTANNGFKVYLPDDNKASIALINDTFEVDNSILNERSWSSALTLQAKQYSHVLHPNIANKEYLKMINYSFRSKILTPLTSYIVVENEAQKAALLRKQEQVLSGSKLHDLDNEPLPMSEPGLFVLLIAFFALFYRHWYNKNRKFVEKTH